MQIAFGVNATLQKGDNALKPKYIKKPNSHIVNTNVNSCTEHLQKN